MKNRMKNLITFLAILSLTTALIGCGSSELPPAEQAKLKEDFQQKEFDINKVPEKDRERVRAMMQQNGGASQPK